VTLDDADRERVEELVAALEAEGAQIERVRSDRSYDDDPLEFRIRGVLP
jgi:hypothetical protein